MRYEQITVTVDVNTSKNGYYCSHSQINRCPFLYEAIFFPPSNAGGKHYECHLFGKKLENKPSGPARLNECIDAKIE